MTTEREWSWRAAGGRPTRAENILAEKLEYDVGIPVDVLEPRGLFIIINFPYPTL